MKSFPAAAAAAVLAAAVSVGVPAVARAQTAASTPAPVRAAQPPSPSDAASLDAIIAALYAGVSHPPNEPPDWSHLRTIFLKDGRLIPPQRPTGEFVFLSPEDFISRVGGGIASRAQKKEDTGFVEREISRRTDCWGNICQVFSTYEGRHLATDPKPFVRGINSIQAVKDGNRWWLVNVLWDQEGEGKPISAEYLPR